MNVNAFLDAVLLQKQDELRNFFHADACIRWHCTNELFSVEEYVRANCEYPGNWAGEIERIEQTGDTIILACRVYSLDENSSFHVVSFIRIKDDLILEMDEYWSDDGAAPKWRRQMKIGKPITQ